MLLPLNLVGLAAEEIAAGLWRRKRGADMGADSVHKVSFLQRWQKTHKCRGNEDAWGPAWLPASQQRERLVPWLSCGLSEMMEQ